MTGISEIKLNTCTSLLRDKSVLYLSNGSCPSVDKYIKRNHKKVSEYISENSYKFVYLPELLSSLSGEIRTYLFPGLTASDEESVITHIQSLLFKGESRNGFIRQENGQIFFYELPETDAYDIANIIDEYTDSLAGPSVFFSNADDGIRYRMSGAEEKAGVLNDSTIESPLGDEMECPLLFSRSIKVSHDEEELDPRTKAILSEIDKIQQRFGVTIEEMELMLGYQVKLSHMHITHTNKIILTDFDDMEIRMDHLSKALFFLYLKHPEGIRYKELCDYREELLDLYLSITGKDDLKAIQKSIDDLVNPQENAINVKVSRVKAAFKSVMSDRVAKFYYIDGTGGEAKKIHLDRDFVIWDR